MTKKIFVQTVDDIDISKGDFYQKHVAPQGEPYDLSVIKKELAEEVLSCFEEYANNHSMMEEEDKKQDENYLWVLGLMHDISLGKEQRAVGYRVGEKEVSDA